jgi:hypothetical protein
MARRHVESRHDHSDTVVQDRPVRDTYVEDDVHARTNTGESEVVSRHAGPWDFASGWIRFLQSLIAFAWLVLMTGLTFRLVFALTGANPANGFVDFIYDVTGPFVAPFENIANEQVDGSAVFEPETVIAMAVYSTAALLIIGFLQIIRSAPAPEREVVTRERSAHYDEHA